MEGSSGGKNEGRMTSRGIASKDPYRGGGCPSPTPAPIFEAVLACFQELAAVQKRSCFKTHMKSSRSRHTSMV